MKTLILVATVSALAAAAPAAAQYGYQSSANAGFDARIDQLEARVDAGVRQGTITRREAWTLRQRLRQLDRLETQYSLNGFTRTERADLQQRIRSLRADVRVADGGGYDRYERYGDWDDGYTGRGGPYEDVAIVCERRSGIGGFIDSLTGNRDCFAVGQRVTSGLDPVPYAYRNQYRDGRGVYYRSDGRSVYEIDARTNTVLRIHRIPRD